VKQVDDPRRFGVVEIGEDGYVNNLIEKPDTMENDLAIIGYYYFSRGEDLMSAIDRQINEDILTKGEYFIADAIKLMLMDGLKLLPKVVNVWLDAGLPETVLSTNRHLLDHGRDNTIEASKREGVTIHPPVYIHPSAEINDSILGPYASIGAGCTVSGSTIEDSILEKDAQIIEANLKESLIGERTRVQRVTGIINVGDDAVVKGS
jgi:glucose-1-phosphate thymidylyltransferase